MKKILGILLCGVLLLGITGCGDNTSDESNNNNSSNANDTVNDSKQEETKTLKVGDYEIKYGYYKAPVNTVGIMEDGKCTWNAVDYLYRVEDNYIIVYELQGEDETVVDRLKLRVENETTLKQEHNGNDIDTLNYYEID